MKRLRYENVHKLALLHDELLAAGITPLVVEEDEGGAAIVVVEDDVADTAVTAVLEAHNPALPSLAEQIDTERLESSEALKTQYQQATTRLNAIVQDGPGYTGAQVRDAVVDLARQQRALLRLVKNAIT